MPCRRERDPSKTLRRWTPLTACLLVACGGGPEPLPPGLLLAGEVGAARAVLAEIERWQGTAAASAARAAGASISGCQGRFSTIRSEGGETSTTCEDRPELASLPRGHALAFALPEGGPGRLVGWIEPGPSLKAEAELQNPTEAGAWGLLLPAEEGPGPLRLSGEGELLHLRSRAARVGGLSELVESGGQGDSMFGLKSDLFAGAILDGTFELAIYLPQREMDLPLAALRVGVRDEGVAKAAFDAWIRQIERTWSIALNREVPGLYGCFREMNMLPELAPCAVIADGAVTVGWNQASLEHALSGAAGTPVDGGLLRVQMAAFPEADRLISLAFAPAEPPPQVPYPWAGLELRARREADALKLSLEARPR